MSMAFGQQTFGLLVEILRCGRKLWPLLREYYGYAIRGRGLLANDKAV